VFGLFRRRRSRQDGEEPAAPSPAEPPAPGRAPLPEGTDGPPEAWAAALGIPVEALEPAVPELDADERLTASAVLAHFVVHKPGPASFPSIALRILELVRRPDVEIGELAALIEQDVAVSAGLLVLANSPVFRGMAQTQTVRDAVARLGLAEVARIAAALSTRSLFRAEVRAEFEVFAPTWNRLFYHSTTVARAASELARLRKLPADPDQVFLAGMLHDVGKSIALRSLAALVLEGRAAVRDPGSIDRILHHVHVQVGADVHREWGLPGHLVLVASRHHDLPAPSGPEATELHLVRLVSALLLLRGGGGVHPAAGAEGVESAMALGLGPARVEALCRTLDETGEWVRMLFGEERGGPSAAR